MTLSRRHFSLATAAGAGAAALSSPPPVRAANPAFKISLAEWSLHKAIRGRMISNLDFPRIAREQFGIDGLEFVNQLWEAPTLRYVAQLKRAMNDTGTQAVLIMCDAEGEMGHSDRTARMRSATAHYRWVEIAAEIGAHAIRTNMYPDKQPQTPTEIDAFLGYCSESFSNLCQYAASRNINVLIENHGGISSNPDVVLRLMKAVNLPNCGTLPDFGNFPKEADRYDAVRKLMTYAKAVSFKTYDFAPTGEEISMDLGRLMTIVSDAGYHNWVGIEYEGSRLPEFEGITASARWLRKRLAQ